LELDKIKPSRLKYLIVFISMNNYNNLLIIIFIIRIGKKLASVINGPHVINWIDFVGIKSVLPWI